MPKIAVLISGEYRKFDITRKTMTFLDDPEVDIYVSTWNKTHIVSKKIDLDCTYEITKEKIIHDLGRDATILIEDGSTFIENIYNSKMIHKWKAGFNIIRNNNIKYDYILVIRPDVFFRLDSRIPLREFAEKYSNKIGIAWANDNVAITKQLADVIFISSYRNIEFLFDNLHIADWENTGRNWHIWWYNFIKLYYDYEELTELGSHMFCRHWVDNTHTFEDVLSIEKDWRYLRLLHEGETHGDDFAIHIWGNEVLMEAKEKWNSGYFDKYK